MSDAFCTAAVYPADKLIHTQSPLSAQLGVGCHFLIPRQKYSRYMGSFGFLLAVGNWRLLSKRDSPACFDTSVQWVVPPRTRSTAKLCSFFAYKDARFLDALPYPPGQTWIPPSPSPSRLIPLRCNRPSFTRAVSQVPSPVPSPVSTTSYPPSAPAGIDSLRS